jgi:type II secretory pathway component PulF
MSHAISLRPKDKLLFIENLGTLLNSGIPIMKALQIILFQAKKPNIRKLSEFLISSIEAGESFFRVAAKLPNVFSVFDVAILEM